MLNKFIFVTQTAFINDTVVVYYDSVIETAAKRQIV